MKKVVKKLSLNKQTMALLNEKEMMNVKGGEGDEKVDFFKSRVLCLLSQADHGCTAHTRCNGGGGSGVVIFCV